MMAGSARGFTLTELLVAMALTTVLMVTLFSALSATLNTWSNGIRRLDEFSGARFVLDRVAGELIGARAAADRMEFRENLPELAAMPGSAGGVASVPDPVPGSAENIFFVAPYPDDQAGDLCAIAYRLAPMDTAGRRTHTLERAFVGSSDAWTPNPDDLAFNQANRHRVTGFTAAGDPVWRPIARGVLEFEIISYSEPDLATGADPAESWNSADVANADQHGKAPRRVVIRLKMLDDKTIAKLSTLPADSSAFQRLVTQNAREFRASVSLPATGDPEA